jgi:hypothetical protein
MSRRKTSQTPKRRDAVRHRMRSLSQTDVAAFNRGYRTMVGTRPLDDAALRDAIRELTLAEAQAVASADREELKILNDMMASRHPDDRRWDSWRLYRKCERSNEN